MVGAGWGLGWGKVWENCVKFLGFWDGLMIFDLVGNFCVLGDFWREFVLG